MMTQKTFVCRCEDVTLDEVEEVLAQGFVSIEEVKRMTGLGTGPCQGKECMVRCALLCLDRGGADEVTPFTARPPYSPTPLGAFAQAQNQTKTDPNA
jgi:sarcosine oxidase subunit beta